MLILGAFLVGLGPWGRPLGSQMADLGCQDTDWVGGNDDVLDAILQLDGLILATLSMDQGKYGDLGCISGWFFALRGAPRVKDGWLRVSGYSLGRWKWQGCFKCDFTSRWPHTTFGMDKAKYGDLILGAFLVVFGPWEGRPLGSQMVDLGYLYTDWVDGNDKVVLDGICYEMASYSKKRILKMQFSMIFGDF